MSRPKKQFNIEQYEKETATDKSIEVIAEVKQEIVSENDPCVGCNYKDKKSQRFCGSCVQYKKN